MQLTDIASEHCGQSSEQITQMYLCYLCQSYLCHHQLHQHFSVKLYSYNGALQYKCVCCVASFVSLTFSKVAKAKDYRKDLC